jgi:hypothetical protein
MAVKLGKRTAVLVGDVSVEEVEPLTQWLRKTPLPAVDLSQCTHLHTAALQALLAADAILAVPPADPFLAAWAAPLLRRQPARGTSGAP